MCSSLAVVAVVATVPTTVTVVVITHLTVVAVAAAVTSHQPSIFLQTKQSPLVAVEQTPFKELIVESVALLLDSRVVMVEGHSFLVALAVLLAVIVHTSVRPLLVHQAEQ